MSRNAAIVARPPARTRVLAAFDFDGTLTDRHTFWRYLLFLAGPARFYGALAALAPSVWRVSTGRLPLMEGRRLLLERLLAGMDAEYEGGRAKRFAQNAIPAYLRSAALQRLRWHQQQGHETAIVSNSAESYLHHVAARLGIDRVFGTRFEVQGGALTGRIHGHDCVGAEKVARLSGHYGELTTYRLYAYGDGSGDRELLAIADEPHFRPFRTAHDPRLDVRRTA